MKPRPHIHVMTGVRSLAAYLVFFHHYPIFKSGSFPWAFFAQLHIGVSFFFVLSGFVICYNYFEEVQLSLEWLGSYFKKRFARIYPIYFLVLAFHATMSGSFDFSSWFLNLTLIKGFFNEFKFSGVSQSWSLTVEETFYALAPLIFFYLRKKEFNKKTYLSLTSFFYLVAFILLNLGKVLDWHGFFWNFRFVTGYPSLEGL